MDKEFLSKLSISFILTALFGEIDLYLKTLFLFIFIDYITGIIKSIVNKNLSSQVGYIGLLKKGSMLFTVIVAHRMDLILHTNLWKAFVISAYNINECISIFENLRSIGVPVPKKILNHIKELKNKF